LRPLVSELLHHNLGSCVVVTEVRSNDAGASEYSGGYVKIARVGQRDFVWNTLTTIPHDGCFAV